MRTDATTDEIRDLPVPEARRAEEVKGGADDGYYAWMFSRPTQTNGKPPKGRRP